MKDIRNEGWAVGNHCSRRHFLGLLAGTAAASATLSSAFAQGAAKDFPTRRISLTVPYGAGSTNDIFGRIMAEGGSEQFGQSVIVENRPGAGGTLGIGQVIRGDADGYSIAVISTSSIAINRALYSSLPYDPAADLTPLSIPCTTPNALIVSASENINSVAELVAKAKSMEPSSVRYNSAGSGTSQHLSGVLFARLAKLKAEHVPYKGQEGITGMLGGQTHFGFATVPSIVGLVRAGKVKILAVTGERPSTAFPDVPTLVSLGYPSFAYGQIWYGVGAPTKVPAPIIKTLMDGFAQVVARPEIKEKFTKAGFDLSPPMSEEQMKTFIKNQVTFWEDLVRESGAKAD